MQSDNGNPGKSSSKILPMVIAAFAGATLAIACERPASRLASAATDSQASAAPPAAQAAHSPQAPATAPAQPAAMPPREALADTVIAGRIQSALLHDPGMTGADVSVSADKGAVTLVGSVKTHEQLAIASAHAQRQDGVTRVDNHLNVPTQ